MSSADDVPLYASLSGTQTELARVPISAEFAARYTLVRLLGAGMMGCVYLAKARSGGFVAVKFLMDPQADLGRSIDNPMLRDRFVREARLMASLQHPHVVQVLDADCLGPHPYLVSEFVEGGTLRERLLRDVSFPPARAVELARQLLSGLAACHEHGFVHRDVKPDNVLLDAAGNAKIADLGLAKDYGDPNALTKTGALMGTPLYMSPEQARGEDAVVGSDLYAVGVILYEMLSGRPPFLAKGLSELLRAHLEATPPPLATLVPEVPEAVSTLVHLALSKTVADRPPTADAFATGLARALAQPARPPSRPSARPPPLARPADATRAGLYAVLGLTTLMLGVVAMLLPARAPVAATSPVASAGSAVASAPLPPVTSPAPADTIARIHRELEEQGERLAAWPTRDPARAEAPLVVTCLAHTSRVRVQTEGTVTLPGGRVVRGNAELAPAEAGLVDGLNWVALDAAARPATITLVREPCPLRPQQRAAPPPEGVLHAQITFAMQENPLDQLPALQLVGAAIPDPADPFRRAMCERIELDGAQNMIQIAAVTEQMDYDPLVTDEVLIGRIRHTLDVLQEAIHRDATRWDGWQDAGAMLRRVGALGAARAALARALMIWPDSAISWRDLGRLERRRWQQLKAARDPSGARRHLAAAVVAYEHAVACGKSGKTRAHMITGAEAIAELADMKKAAAR